jgi:hypothetical protein
MKIPTNHIATCLGILSRKFWTRLAARGWCMVKKAQLTPNAKVAIEFWLHRGWAIEKACGIVGHMQVESYPDLRTEVVGDKHIKAHNGIPEGSYGICQWNGPRKMWLFSYAAKQNMKPSDLLLQLEFCAYELNTTEKFAGEQLTKAWTVYGATRAFMHFERPRGYSVFWPTLGSHFDRRLDAATKLFNEWKGLKK